MKPKKFKTYIKYLIPIFLLILIAIVVGLRNSLTVDFYPTNGDFQNYNPVRRFLAGQIPFKDFAVYLGVGHLYLLSFFQLIMGNNFATSIFVTNMVSMLLFELLAFIISYFILNDKRKALDYSLLLSTLNLIRPTFLLGLISPEFLNGLNLGVDVGNSARLIRNSVIFISTIVGFVGLHFMNTSTNNFIKKHRDLLKKIYFAIVGGMCILWSNDGGIATYIAWSFVYFLLLIKDYSKDIKSIFKYTLFYILVSVITFFLILFLVTRGHISSWFTFTLGVSSYQSWYYSEAPTKLNISLYQLDFSLPIIMAFFLAIYFIYKLFHTQNAKEQLNYAFLEVIVIAAFISSFLYQWISGGYSKEILDLVLLIIFSNYITKFIIEHVKNTNMFKYLSSLIAIFAFGGILSLGITAIENKQIYNDSNAIYMDKLKGYLTFFGDDINYVNSKLNGENVFSLYASALEVEAGTYQPSGYDYIIHVLGDKNREKYLQTFNEGNFKYVATTDRDYLSFRYWIKNANWFFYKELYKNYVPVMAHNYNMFWEKRDKEDIDVNTTIQVNRLSDEKVQLVVYVDNATFNGVASVKISYNSVFKNSFWQNFDVHKYVYVDDITGKQVTDLPFVNYNIPLNCDEYYIPITILNGVGEVQLSSYPLDNTFLAVDSASVDDLFDDNFKYGGLSYWRKPVGNTLYAVDTKENQIIFANAKYLKINDIVASVENIYNDNGYIAIEVSNNADSFAYPNMFEVIK